MALSRNSSRLDNRSRSTKASIHAAADVVMTSGGVSVGDADYVKQMLDRLGEVLFWKIAMKPGRPLAYGKIGKAHFFFMPGVPTEMQRMFDEQVVPRIRDIAPNDSHQIRFRTFGLPESVVGEKLDARSDLFSLGVIAYQMLCSRLPYGTDVSQARTRSAQKKLRYRSVLSDTREIPAWLDAALANPAMAAVVSLPMVAAM